MSHEPRPAQAQDVPAVRTVLARAYDGNPLLRWVFPDDATRPDATAMWLGPAIEQYLAVGLVHVVELDGRVVGVAAWRFGRAVSPPTTLPTPAGALAALVGRQRAAEVLAALAGTRDLAPASATPLPYLNYLAVDPDHQGHGHGGRLVRAGWASVGEESWLGTTDPTNVPFYERLGYSTFARRNLGDGPELALMARRGQAGSGSGSGSGSANHTTVSP
jgi:GNAT superfamily N-acetyltransferase